MVYSPTMRIIVLVKQVPETDSLALDPETGTVIRSEDRSIVNPLDLYALETALRIKEARPETKVLALSMGPPQAESALREAIAMGCDEAALISGREFAASDTWATSRALAAAVGKLGSFDLVLCGEKATDGDTGQVGPEVAAFLDLPVLSYVGKLELFEGPVGPSVRVERVLEDGIQVLECPQPLVVTCCKAIGEPRLPTLAGKKKAHESALRRLGLAELGIGPGEVGSKGSPTRVVKIDRPRLSRDAERVDGRGEGLSQAVSRIVALLVDKGVVAPRAPAAREPRGPSVGGGR
jgi:electron transfer flavoprotein beta subunit